MLALLDRCQHQTCQENVELLFGGVTALGHGPSGVKTLVSADSAEQQRAVGCDGVTMDTLRTGEAKDAARWAKFEGERVL